MGKPFCNNYLNFVLYKKGILMAFLCMIKTFNNRSIPAVEHLMSALFCMFVYCYSMLYVVHVLGGKLCEQVGFKLLHNFENIQQIYSHTIWSIQY